MLTTGFPVLDLSKQGPQLAHNSQAVMRQIGWIGHTGSVYAYDDPPLDGKREPAGYFPLYIQIGTWQYMGDGRYSIKD